MSLIVQDNMVVSLAYTLKLANGKIVDYSEAGEPLEYLHGAGNILPSLEEALIGLRIGDTRDVEISPEDGYGEYDPEDVQLINVNALPENLKLELGMVLMVTDEEKNMMEAYVREIGPQHVALDFNHPLAGQSLYFSVEVVDVREATPEETEHGHPHGAHGHDHDDDDEDDDEGESEFEFYLENFDDSDNKARFN